MPLLCLLSGTDPIVANGFNVIRRATGLVRDKTLADDSLGP
jgi:hypothetical protein